MKHTHMLAGLLIAVVAVTEAAERKDVVTPAGYAFKPNANDYYPSASKNLREQGAVKVRVCYDTKGRIQDSSVDESSGFERLD